MKSYWVTLIIAILLPACSIEHGQYGGRDTGIPIIVKTTQPSQTRASTLTATDKNLQTRVARLKVTLTANAEQTKEAENKTATVLALTPPTPRQSPSLTLTWTPILPTITPATLPQLEAHDLALNEKSVLNQLEPLAEFGPNDDDYYTFPVTATGIRFDDGETTYLLAVNGEVGYGDDIDIWNLGSETIIQSIPFDEKVDDLLFHPDQKTLISLSHRDTINIIFWDIQTGKVLQQFDMSALANGRVLPPLALHSDGLRLAFFTVIGWGSDFRISELNLQTRQVSDSDYQFTVFAETQSPYLYLDNGDLLSIIYDQDNRLHFLNLSKNEDTELEFPFSDLSEVIDAWATIETMAVSLDQKYVAGGARSGQIYIWDLFTQELVHILDAHPPRNHDLQNNGIRKLEFGPNSKLLISMGYDGETKLWNVETGALLNDYDICCFGKLTPDGRYLVTVGQDKIRLWGVDE